MTIKLNKDLFNASARQVHPDWILSHKTQEGHTAKLVACPACGVTMHVRDVFSHVEWQHTDDEPGKWCAMLASRMPTCSSCGDKMLWDVTFRTFKCSKCDVPERPGLGLPVDKPASIGTEGTPVPCDIEETDENPFPDCKDLDSMLAKLQQRIERLRKLKQSAQALEKVDLRSIYEHILSEWIHEDSMDCDLQAGALVDEFTYLIGGVLCWASNYAKLHNSILPTQLRNLAAHAKIAPCMDQYARDYADAKSVISALGPFKPEKEDN